MSAQSEEFILLYVTFPDLVTAERLSHVLIEENLIACANILPGIQSMYPWEGKIEHTQESIGILKSREKHFKQIEKRILELHPYKTPAILQLSITDGHLPYLNWIKSVTT